MNNFLNDTNKFVNKALKLTNLSKGLAEKLLPVIPHIQFDLV